MNEEPKITNHELSQELHKVHEILDEHNKDEFLYRQKVAGELEEARHKREEQHKEVMTMLEPMAKIFESVTGFNGVAVWILKALILIGAAFGVFWGAIKWLKN